MLSILTAADTASETAGIVFKDAISVWLPALLGNDETVTSIVNLVAAFFSMILPYLIGSIQPGVILSRLFWHADIREYDDGSPDALHMLQVFGKRAGFFTLLCNALKTALAMLLGLWLWGFSGRSLAGFFVLFGHLFPVFYRFRGGHGATCMTVFLLLTQPIVGALFLVIFLVGGIGTRMIAFGLMLAALLNPMILQAFHSLPDLSVAMSILAAVFILVAHRENIGRILNGNEEKIELSTLFQKKGDR